MICNIIAILWSTYQCNIASNVSDNVNAQAVIRNSCLTFHDFTRLTKQLLCAVHIKVTGHPYSNLTQYYSCKSSKAVCAVLMINTMALAVMGNPHATQDLIAYNKITYAHSSQKLDNPFPSDLTAPPCGYTASRWSITHPSYNDTTPNPSMKIDR